jgi:dTDP-4-dehydrorhamnose 3,5-epimerase-like enzyme
MVGAGAVVTRDVPANAIVMGNPARIAGYTNAEKPVRSPVGPIRAEARARPAPLRTAGPVLLDVPKITDLRGALSYAEVGAQLPFVPKRFFVVYDVPSTEVRGEHAHKQLEEFLVCVKGSCNVMVDDGSVREEVTLDSPSLGLYIPPRIWRVHYKYSADSVLLVLASHIYDADDYIRDYGDFVAYVGKA